ncbi:MAG TPA: secretin N-terminal domain-containing protein, partial [Prosthecobacter sp.]|nr:secretin N-terminal domain-containing protein [Prosthecobacter sp.]
ASADPAEREAIRPEDAIKPGGGVELQFPNTPLSQILLVYEDLTGLKIIRDANAEQATVSIETTGELPKDKAIMFIEKSLLLNGYSFVPAGEGMVKLLSEAKKPQTEGAPFIESAFDLPETDQVVNHVVILKHLNTEDAQKAIDQVIPRHSYGLVHPVPNAKALVITENSNTIRSILALLERIDNKPAPTISRTIQLTRSDAEDVKKALEEILGLSESGSNSSGGSRGSGARPAVPNPGAAQMGIVPQGETPQAASASAAGGGTASSTEETPPKIHAIVRRNCLLVMASPETMETIQTLVDELDAASDLRNFVSRTLKYLGVEAALGIISDAISRTEGGENGGAGGGVNSLGQSGAGATNTQTNSGGLFGNNNSNTGGGGLFGNNNNSGGFGSGLGGGLGGGGFGGGGSGFGGGGGNLQPLRPNNGPRSLVIGKTLLISDPVANSVFASGPPEHLRILNEILDELDRRPQQILISAVIGEAQYGKEGSIGIEYLIRARERQGSGFTRGLAGQLGQAAVLPLDPRTAVPLADLALRSGLTFYGGVREGLDLIVHTLQTSSDFKVISRPSVFTMNNTAANISSGSSFPIATSTQGLIGGGTTGTGLLSNVQYQDVVLSLNIVPLINSDDELTLQISQENSEVAGSTVIAENTYPILTKQQLNTVVMCKNNSTVLLGGLIRESDEDEKTNVPILGSIPFIKHLIGTTRKEDNRRELLIMLQPSIIEGMHDIPPGVRHAPGSSPFGEETTRFISQEKSPVYEQVPVERRNRVMELARKLFKRPQNAQTEAAVVRRPGAR